MDDGQQPQQSTQDQQDGLALSGLNTNPSAIRLGFSLSGPGSFLRVSLLVLVIVSIFGFGGRMFWWADLMGYPRLHLSVIITVIGLYYVFRRELQLIFLAVLGLILNLLAAAIALPNNGIIEAAATLPGSIEVATLNINVDNPNQGAIINWINEEKPDIVVLIEANREWLSITDKMLASMPYRSAADSSGRYGIIIMSRFPLDEAASTRAGPDSLPTLSAKAETPIGQIQLIAIHPNPPISAEGFRARNQYLAQVSAMAQTTPMPSLIMGDFSTVPWSSGFETIRNLPNLQPEIWRMPATWPAKAGHFGLPLDNILLTVPYASMHRLVMDKVTAGPEIIGTTHRPVIAQVSVR